MGADTRFSMIDKDLTKHEIGISIRRSHPNNPSETVSESLPRAMQLAKAEAVTLMLNHQR